MPRRSTLTAVLSVALCLALSAQAAAMTTISRSGNTVTITGGDEVNYVEQVSPGDSGPLRYKDPSGISFDGELHRRRRQHRRVRHPRPRARRERQPRRRGRHVPPRYASSPTAPQLTWTSAPATTRPGAPPRGHAQRRSRQRHDHRDGRQRRDRRRRRATTASPDRAATTRSPAARASTACSATATSAASATATTPFARATARSTRSPAASARTRRSPTRTTRSTFSATASPGTSRARSRARRPARAAAAPLTVALGEPKTLRLGAFLSGKPLKFTVTFSAACTTTIGLVVRKAEAKRLKIGTKDTVIARAVDQVPQGGNFSATLKIKRAFRAKLRNASR